MRRTAAGTVALVVLALLACKKKEPPPTVTTTEVAPAPAGPFSYNGTWKMSNGNTLEISRSGAHYRCAFTSSSATLQGVGIQQGDVLGCGVGGKRYGVAVYKVNGGSLDGLWTDKRSPGKVAKEVARGPAGVIGTYNIIPPTGYKGRLEIKQTGETRAVTWKVGNQIYAGTGLLSDNVFVVSYGFSGERAGAVKLKPDGSGGLRGEFAFHREKSITRFTATKSP